MTIREIVYYPSEKLREKSTQVDKIDDDIKQLVEDMFETLYHIGGIGLAAPQIGVQKKVYILDLSEDRSTPLVFINPQILTTSGKSKRKEGCLSIPEYYEYVSRPAKVVTKAQSIDSKEFSIEAEDLLSAAIQHETDHLNGVLFIDHLSKLKQHLFQNWYKKSELYSLNQKK